MNSSLERIYPDEPQSSSIAGSETLTLHLARYEFASDHILPGLIADIACGAGYGSHLIAKANPGVRIIAVDADPDALDYARAHYPHDRIEYIQADAMEFFAGKNLDVIISLETIEHLKDPKGFVKHMAGQLSPGGRFIASAPITPSMDANPFHFSDFTGKSFRKLFTDCGLKEIDSMIQVQPFDPFAVVRHKDSVRNTRKNLVAYYLSHPSKFFLRLRSTLIHGFKNKYIVLVFEK